eukprot:TRINITY_DN3690_c0_g1_i2.p1 TRINITY_DN3690_c0_g1~~TRINITY_DN3690_c0_g1_i2.p1  ORF type:complete len:1154 (-),score=336.56 TRINITY_DN3690_c0_g1_i2:321-3782(-)
MTKEGEETTTSTTTTTVAQDAAPAQNGEVAGGENPAQQDFQVSIKVKLFGKEEPIPLTVSKLDTVQDLKQFLFEVKEICHVTAYSFVLNGKKLVDVQELGTIEELVDGSLLEMQQDTYDERSARQHLRRLRELLAVGSEDLTSVFVQVSGGSLEDAEHKPQQAQQETHGGKKKQPQAQQHAEKEGEIDSEKLDITKTKSVKLGEYYPSHTQPTTQCLKSLVYSGWNPVPGYRKLQGDLFYLEAVTSENKAVTITAAVDGFFINSCTPTAFNPAPATPVKRYHTLVDLLSAISPLFAKSFNALINRYFEKHPFEVLPAIITTYPWIDRSKKHYNDPNRAEDYLLNSFETDPAARGVLRDWNEEYQTCKAFPKATIQDRIFRDRAISKVVYDFVEVATKGAVAIVNKSILPLNPMDAEKSHMYIFNNIFFSHALDARDIYLDIGGDKAAHKAANNDLKGVISYNTADVDGLHTLLTAMIDYRGYRLVAQSIIPGILHREETAVVLYGSKDHTNPGKTIVADKTFHELMTKAGKLLHISEHEVVDEEGNVVKLSCPIECKGISGTDNRRYILDLIRSSPRDANYPDIKDTMRVLRHELVYTYVEHQRTKKKLEEAAKKQQEQQQAASEQKEQPKAEETQPQEEEELDISFNLNVLSKAKLGGSEEEKKSAEDLVKELTTFLNDAVIPSLVDDFSQFFNSPVDGASLTQAMHIRGINVRYLGRLAQLSGHLQFIKELCEREMICRAAKHIFNASIKPLEITQVSSFVANFLNSLLGGSAPATAPATTKASEHAATNGTAATSKKGRKKANKQQTQQTHSTPKLEPVKGAFTSSSLWEAIRNDVKETFNYELSASRPTLQPIATLRGFCLKVGVTVDAKDYNFSSDSPFQPHDILDLFPVVKHTNPRSFDGVELLEAGKSFLAQSRLDIAFELFTDALSIIHQVHGPLHQLTAQCYTHLATVLYHANDIQQAISYQKKSVLINERIQGIDNHDTTHGYTNLGLFYQTVGKPHLALTYLKRALYLGAILSGSTHPDNAGAFASIANILRDVGKYQLAKKYFKEALRCYETTLGETLISAQLSHEIAISYSMLDDFKKALNYERRNYSILSKVVPETDVRIVELTYGLSNSLPRPFKCKWRLRRLNARSKLICLKSVGVK